MPAAEEQTRCRDRIDAEQLFRRWFRPLYPPELREDLARARTTDVNPANNPNLLVQLDAVAETFAELAPVALDRPELELDFSDASIHRLAAALKCADRDALLAATEEAGPPRLVQLVIHGVAYVGACAVRNHDARWSMRNPLWESLVELRSRAGVAQLCIFQWWLKALSEEEIDAPTLADRYRLHVEIPTARPEELPVLAEPGRKLPRLNKVRYDTLYQYLRAHLPELAGVGDHFPSPERFAEMSFSWLDFELLGAGRMLLMHGPGERGVHLFWLDTAGFRSAAFFPADAAPEHRLRAEGDKLVVELPVLGTTRTHEMLWWGS
jgi:hypothetical protein